MEWSRVLGHRQTTDACLLTLAVSLGGRLFTFDHRIAVGAIPGTETSHLCVLE